MHLTVSDEGKTPFTVFQARLWHRTKCFGQPYNRQTAKDSRNHGTDGVRLSCDQAPKAVADSPGCHGYHPKKTPKSTFIRHLLGWNFASNI
ncbi:hypothetical protein CEXT_615031 [Caerostris extrusa]|uniref:Uncharacterized protein n=1 Tax=Caerostris extrusa TaxID=172846 RepID=A0AAV4UH63_CAEEX|nr:hypothetical protein CEXT_105501 [Caerostris extrusa]GIY57153.1 hypothetical protein CEXT_105531 [Caerostris extrusa]GIY92689.1 hypothetical protein CEXT_615031 [Caerostris extrusa]